MGLLDLQIPDTLPTGDDRIVLPTREGQTSFEERRRIVEIGKPSLYHVQDESGSVEAFTQIEGARLTRFRARWQPNRHFAADPVKENMDLVTFTEITLDSEETGLMVDGKAKLLPAYTHQLFQGPDAWNDTSKRPHRIHGQNWGSDPALVAALYTLLQERMNWRINPAPRRAANRPGAYKRTTQDVFDIVPPRPQATAGQSVNWTNYGAPIEAFEVSTNNYPGSFQDFATATTEQITRLLEAYSEPNEQLRNSLMEKAALFVNVLTGVSYGKDGRPWPNHADIGMFAIGGSEFRIWDGSGQAAKPLTVEDILAGAYDNSREVTQGAPKLVVGDLVAGREQPSGDTDW